VASQLFYRCEHDDWDFLDGRGSVFDAALVAARYLAPYPNDHPSFGKDPTRLAVAVKRTGRPVQIDPGTAGLCSRSVLKSGAARLRNTACAGVCDLPLKEADLRSRTRREAFVDAAIESQSALTDEITAPYLDQRGASDPRFELNILMVQRTVASVGPEYSSAFLQGTRGSLVSGAMAGVVAGLATTGVKRVFIRPRGLAAQEATAEELEAFAWVIELFSRRGVQAVPDSVGRLGPFLVAAGASAFTTGAHNFRSVPAPLLSVTDKKNGKGGGGGGREVTYELETGGELPRDEAPPVSRNYGQAQPSSGDDRRTRLFDGYRAHRLQVLREAAREAAADPRDFLRSREQSSDPHERVWAKTLLERLRKRA